MLKRSFRNYALSLAGGALLLGGSSVAGGAMTLPLPGAVADQAAAAVFTDGAGAAKVEQVYWRGRGGAWRRGGWRGRGYGWHRGYGWRARGYGWHRGWGWHGGGYWRHRGWGWHRGYGWRGRGW